MDLPREALALGADRAGVVHIKDVRFDRAFRKLCRQNSCGKYGKSWMCPPHIGDIDMLIARAKRYDHMLVFQIVDQLADCYDIEGMLRSAKRINNLCAVIRDYLSPTLPADTLYLGAGACRICERCAILDGRPCCFPEKAIASLESYGVDVSQLASLAGMDYINGYNTVTYFGAVLYNG